MLSEKKQTILNKLFALQRFGIKPGLERTLELLEAVGNPYKKLKAIHVAGTNGKGSVCSMIASILMESGYKTALYTSPHIVDFNERIRINGNKITDEELVKYAEILLPFSDKIGCSFFEITTALAFLYFADKNVDIAVIETGLGGRFDSTNVLQPLISIITNISLEHREYLGNTLAEIAFEKAGIIKHEIPVIIGDYNPATSEVFIEKAKECNSPIYFIDERYMASVQKWNLDFSMLVNAATKTKSYKNISLPLAGEHQLKNLLTVLKAMELMNENITIPENSIYLGLKKVKENMGIEARIDLIRTNPAVVVDVSHNPDSIHRLVDTLKKCGYNEKWNIVFAAMSDKDADTSLSILKSHCTHLFVCTPKIDRAMNCELLKEKALKLGFKNILAIDDCLLAVEAALTEKKNTLILGSFYLIGEILPHI